MVRCPGALGWGLLVAFKINAYSPVVLLNIYKSDYASSVWEKIQGLSLYEYPAMVYCP